MGAAGIALLALYERLHRLPRLPFADADSWSYLAPAVLLFTEGEYLHTGSREFLYPLFVHAVVRVFGSWSAVSVVQHVVGVAGGLVLLAAWMRIPLPEQAPAPLRVARRALGLGLLAAHLFLAQTIVYEHLLRPESISQPVAALAVFGAVGLLGLRRDGPWPPRRLVADGTLLVLAAAVLAALRPQTLLVLPAAVALLVAVLVRLRPRPRVAALALGLPLALSTLGIWIPERILAADDPHSGRFMSGVLFFWHFHLVDDVLESDLRQGRLAPRDEALVRELFDAFEEEKRRHAEEGKWYHFQGYNPDALYYGRAGRRLGEHFGPNSEAYEAFAVETFLRAVGRRPFGYAEKILTNLGQVYAWPGGEILNHRLYYHVPRLVETTLLRLEPEREAFVSHSAGQEYLAALVTLRDALGDPEDPRTWFLGSERLAKRISDLYLAVQWLHVPLLVVAVLLFLLPSPWRDRPLAESVLVVALLAFAAHLTSSLVHGLETIRYVFGVASLSFFTVFAAALLVATRATGWMLHGRLAAEPGGPRAPSRPSS